MRKKGVEYLTTEIAQAFQSYYSALYAVGQEGTQEGVLRRTQKENLPKLSVKRLQFLEEPINLEEIEAALKNTPNR